MEISYAVNRVLFQLLTRKYGLVAGNTGDEGGESESGEKRLGHAADCSGGM